MAVASSKLTGYVTNLVEGFGLPDEGERRFARALYDRLANGRPVSRQALAEALELPAEAVRDALDQLPPGLVEFDADGNVTEFVGLGLETSPHEFVVRGNTLHTWCAWDSLFIPAILGETVEVVSTAPITGDTIRITVGPDGIEGVDPADAVMTFATPAFEVMHGSESVEDVQFAFCDWVYFFPSPAAADEWLKDNRGPSIVPVAKAYELARHMNKARFPDLVK